MYLHLGQETVVLTEDIIGVFDLDSTTVSRHTRDFLNRREKEKKVITVSYELPKSFVLCGKKGEKAVSVYLSQLSPSTLLKRSSREDEVWVSE